MVAPARYLANQAKEEATKEVRVEFEKRFKELERRINQLEHDTSPHRLAGYD